MFEIDWSAAQAYANNHFKPKLRRYESVNKVWLWLPGLLLTWAAALFILFFLTAYRPVLDFDGFKWLEIEWDGSEAQPDDHFSEMQNRNSAISLREYLGRTVGAIPPACAITQGNLPRPTGPGTPGQPGILALLGYDQGEVRTPYAACRWRNDPRSILAAWSFDVGIVQKVTLLLLIIALFILIRNKRFRDIEQEAWPVNDMHRGKSKPGTRKNKDTSQYGPAPEIAHHPIRLTRASATAAETGTSIPAKMLVQTFYPTEDLPLDPMTVADTAVRKYDDGLSEVADELYDKVYNNSLRGPVDLIKDVLRAGAHSGRAGDAERRMRVAAYEYTTSLSDRLEMAHYLMWLLPTVGFLGTIYGISASLVRAKGLFGGEATLDPNDFSQNIQLVVDGLGVAFDTTSMALVCSAYLYWRLVRAEQDIRVLSMRARDSLSNLLVDRLVDRVDMYSPKEMATEPPASSETGNQLEVPTSEPDAPAADPDTLEQDAKDGDAERDDDPAGAGKDGSPGVIR